MQSMSMVTVHKPIPTPIYIQPGNPPWFMDGNHRHTLHESVILRLQKRADYRPQNLLKICPDVNKVSEFFDVEKWIRL